MLQSSVWQQSREADNAVIPVMSSKVLVLHKILECQKPVLREL